MSAIKKNFLTKLSKSPVFCFTSDLDWASEDMIESILMIFMNHNIPFTPFLTHRSKIIERHYKSDDVRNVGIHPNFLPGSTHGNNINDIISHTVGLWPGAKGFRSHSFFDNTLITNEFRKRGFSYDSNLCLHLQPNLIPLQHSSGLIRFPVFLEDDFYAMRENSWELSHIEDLLKAPGLKVFNFHPQYVALNIPSVAYYEEIKIKEDMQDNWKKYVYNGQGARTFLIDLLNFIKKSYLEAVFLDNLYASC